MEITITITRSTLLSLRAAESIVSHFQKGGYHEWRVILRTRQEEEVVRRWAQHRKKWVGLMKREEGHKKWKDEARGWDNERKLWEEETGKWKEQLKIPEEVKAWEEEHRKLGAKRRKWDEEARRWEKECKLREEEARKWEEQYKQWEEEAKTKEERHKMWEEDRQKREESIEKWKEERKKWEEECQTWEEECQKRKEDIRHWKEEREKWEEAQCKRWAEGKNRDKGAKGLVGLSGHFDSWQTRNSGDLRQHEWKEINFYGSKIDAILTGLNCLDVDLDWGLRVKAYACELESSCISSYKIALETWSDSRMYGSGCDWIALYLSAHPDVQCGSFNTTEDHPPWRPQVTTVKNVTFARKYTKEEGIPDVAIWFNSVDIAKPSGHFNFATWTSNISRNGFTIHVNSCNETWLHSARVSWISHPKRKKGIDSGQFGTLKERGVQSDSWIVTFNDMQINHVFIGLKALEGDEYAATRLKLVAESGQQQVQWRVKPPNSAMYKADGTVVVLE